MEIAVRQMNHKNDPTYINGIVSGAGVICCAYFKLVSKLLEQKRRPNFL